MLKTASIIKSQSENNVYRENTHWQMKQHQTCHTEKNYIKDAKDFISQVETVGSGLLAVDFPLG